MHEYTDLIHLYVTRMYINNGIALGSPRKGRKRAGRGGNFFKPTRLAVQPTWGELL